MFQCSCGNKYPFQYADGFCHNCGRIIGNTKIAKDMSKAELMQRYSNKATEFPLATEILNRTLDLSEEEIGNRITKMSVAELIWFYQEEVKSINRLINRLEEAIIVNQSKIDEVKILILNSPNDMLKMWSDNLIKLLTTHSKFREQKQGFVNLKKLNENFLNEQIVIRDQYESDTANYLKTETEESFDQFIKYYRNLQKTVIIDELEKHGIEATPEKIEEIMEYLKKQGV